MRGSRPHRDSWSTPARIRACVDRVSEPYAATVEHGDPSAGPGQQHRGRGAGHPAADDHDVVVVSSTRPPSRAARTRPGTGARQRPVHLNRAPSMNVESRRFWNHWPTAYRPGAAVAPRYWRILPSGATTGTFSHGWCGRNPVASTTVAMPSARRSMRLRVWSRETGRGRRPGSTSSPRCWASTYASSSSSNRVRRASASRRGPLEVRLEVDAVPVHAGQAAHQLDADVLEGRQVEVGAAVVVLGSRPAIWSEGSRRACGAIARPSSTPGQLAGPLHPPEGVHPPVPTRHPGVASDGKDDPPARPRQLVGDLRPRRRGADHEHAPGGELVRVPVRRRAQHRDVGAEAVDPPGRCARPDGPEATTTFCASQEPAEVVTW